MYSLFAGKKNLTETIFVGTQTLELLVKDENSTILNMFSELKETIDKKTDQHMETNICSIGITEGKEKKK